MYQNVEYTFATNVCNTIKDRKLSVGTMEQHLSKSRGWLSRRIKQQGNCRVTLQDACNVADYLEVPLQNLLENVDNHFTTNE